jgi:Tfp pilus assembly protein PilE
LELLAIITVVGLLASIAIAKYGQTKRRTVMAVMKGDLHNLTVLAEAFYATYSTYEGFTPPGPSKGVTIEFQGSGSGWSATARHPEASDVTCSAGNIEGANTEPVCR